MLVTGPTGSGKSTTLAAMMDYANLQRHDHIITVEDPIEFVHRSQKCLVQHREVGVHTRSFASALRGALREDPDILLVGEMRDLETIELALTAAATGHLVFGTLHTSSAAKAVDRIIDVFPTDQQNQIRATLAESLKGVIAQNLFKRIDKPGRVAALEILVVDMAIANLVREGKTHQIPGMIQVGKKKGNQPLDDAIMEHLRHDPHFAGRSLRQGDRQKEIPRLPERAAARRCRRIESAHENTRPRPNSCPRCCKTYEGISDLNFPSVIRSRWKISANSSRSSSIRRSTR